MKTTLSLLLFSAAFLAGPKSLGQSTAFTYQGRLQHGGTPANGLYEINFALFDALTNGSPVGVTATVAPVPVTNGLFTATLDFGPAAFMGTDRWLEIAVTVLGSDQPVVTLVPRQPLTPAPYALHAYSAAGLMSIADAPLDIKVNGQRALRLEPTPGGLPNVVGGAGDNEMGLGVQGAVIGGGSMNWIGTNVTCSTIGGGTGNSITQGAGVTVAGGDGNTAQQSGATVAGGRGNQSDGFCTTVGGGFGNRGSGYYAIVAGGRNNSTTSDYATVSGGHKNASDGDAATVGGGAGNSSIGIYTTVGGGGANGALALGATVSGGGENFVTGTYGNIGGGRENLVSNSYGTVGGGTGNEVSAAFATVAGGSANTATTDFATVGGGGRNVAAGYGATVAGGGGFYFDGDSARNIAAAPWSTVGGGAQNAALGTNSTIGGGSYNVARGENAVIPGGYGNIADGAYSFAAGENAFANHAGAFVWADASFVALHSTTNNQFTARAAGGVRFFADTNATTGAELAPGSGTWSSLSDRNAKENFAGTDTRAILDKVAALPMASWNYRTQEKSVRHLGPMAQDFHAAFGLGESDRTITTVDADGVALAAIQGLNAKLREELQARDERIQKLEQRLEALAAALAASAREP